MGGQNLSLQVHPLTEYIQNTFGMHYTQDESYYILDCEEEAQVYLGLKENIDKVKMLSALQKTQDEGAPFATETFVNAWPVKKHDHFLIPAGTVYLYLQALGLGACRTGRKTAPSAFTTRKTGDSMGQDNKVGKRKSCKPL